MREAGDAFSRYVMIAQPYYAMYPRAPQGYVDENGKFIYALRLFPPGAQSAAVTMFEAEFRLASTLRVWDACGNKSVADPSVTVRLAYPEPPYVALYRQLPCTSVEFGCEQSSIAAHVTFFTKPFRTYRRSAFEQLIRRCEQELSETQLEPTVTAKVRWHVYAHFNEPVAVDEVGDILHMTPRSLTRRLAQERTTFRQIVHDVRMEITAHHLQASKLSVEDVSELMGFSSASSLRRAIRNWTGDTPSRLRAPKRTLARTPVRTQGRSRKRKTRT